MAPQARLTARSADGRVTPVDHHVLVRTEAPRLRPSRIPIRSHADSVVQTAAVALRPSQIRATGPRTMSAIQREQLTDQAAPSDERLGVPGAAASVLDVVARGTGQALDQDTRADMETMLGADMSRVRVHTDAAAGRSALAIGARAYTIGNDVVFGPGVYAPATAEGRRTLAHELTHVQQQRKGPVTGTEIGGGIAISGPGDSFEREAAANAEKAVSTPALAAPSTASAPAPDVGGGSRGAVVQREPKQPRVQIPQSPSRQAMIKELKDEHPGLNDRVADDAVNGAKRVMGAGGAGGDVVLDEHVTREVSVHAGRLDQPNLTTHLQAEARQAGVREIYLQINSPGATTQSIRQVMDGIQNGIPELKGIRVRVYDSQGRVVWQGNMRFRDTDPIRSRPGGGGGTGTGSSGGTRPGPSSGGPAPGGPGRRTGPSPATGTGLAGGKPPTPTSTLGVTTSAATRAQMAKAIIQGDTATARAVALTARIKIYVQAYGALTHLLSLLSAIDDMQAMQAHGTALPKEQEQADKVLSDSNRAKDEADQVTEDFSVSQWVIVAGEMERANDDKSLFDIAMAASALSHSLEDSAAEAQGLAEDLNATAEQMLGEMYKQLVYAIMPNMTGTVDNAIAAALFSSLQTLRGTTLSASRNYAEAADTLKWWAEQLRGISRWAHDSAWAILRGRAWERYRAEHPEASGSTKP